MEEESAAPSRSAHGRARRRTIVEAAEKVFGEAGYANATTAAIAREVGISQPALYRYFASKRDLFLEALALRQKAIEAGVREALAAPGSAREKIRSIARSTVQLALAHPQMAMLRMQAVALAPQDEEVRRVVRNSLDRMIALHEQLIAQAVEDGSLAAHVEPRPAASVIAGQAFVLYVSITADHALANADDAHAGIDDLLTLLGSPPG